MLWTYVHSFPDTLSIRSTHLKHLTLSWFLHSYATTLFKLFPLNIKHVQLFPLTKEKSQIFSPLQPLPYLIPPYYQAFWRTYLQPYSFTYFLLFHLFLNPRHLASPAIFHWTVLAKWNQFSNSPLTFFTASSYCKLSFLCLHNVTLFLSSNFSVTFLL